MAEPGELVIDIAVFVEIHVASGTDRRHLAVVDRDVRAGRRIVNQHEPAATEIARPRQGHCQRETYRNSGIDGIAAVCENLRADLRGQVVLGSHHAGRPERRMHPVVVADDRGLGDLGGCLGRDKRRDECRRAVSA